MYVADDLAGLDAGTAARVAGEEAKILSLSRTAITVETPVRMNLAAESSVELCLSGITTRLRGRVVKCSVKSLSSKGPRYELGIEFGQPLPVPALPASPAPSPGFDLAGIEWGDPDPALAANSW